MVRLQLIDLNDNDINEIYLFSFIGLQSIVDLHFSMSEISKLNGLSFFRMPNLKHLNLSANRILTIAYSMCHWLTAIQSIDLRLNKIMFLKSLRLTSMLSTHTVNIYLDTMVCCCPLFKSINCFVNEKFVELPRLLFVTSM